jgi:hypothetical protein
VNVRFRQLHLTAEFVLFLESAGHQRFIDIEALFIIAALEKNVGHLEIGLQPIAAFRMLARKRLQIGHRLLFITHAKRSCSEQIQNNRLLLAVRILFQERSENFECLFRFVLTQIRTSDGFLGILDQFTVWKIFFQGVQGLDGFIVLLLFIVALPHKQNRIIHPTAVRIGGNHFLTFCDDIFIFLDLILTQTSILGDGHLLGLAVHLSCIIKFIEIRAATEVQGQSTKRDRQHRGRGARLEVEELQDREFHVFLAGVGRLP